MTAPMGYNEIDGVEEFGTFQMADEATRPFGPAGRVFVRGGLSSATLNTPKGPATLNLPSPVPTLAQFRLLEQAVNVNNQRVTVEAGPADPGAGRGEEPGNGHVFRSSSGSWPRTGSTLTSIRLRTSRRPQQTTAATAASRRSCHSCCCSRGCWG